MSAFATLATGFPALTADRGYIDLSQTDSQRRTLELFLASVERKAFKMAQVALRHEDDALDAVQDAMLALVKSYGGRAEAELKPLFYRILENKILDVQRRRTVRGRVMGFFPTLRNDDDEESTADPMAQAPDLAPLPVAKLQADEAMQALAVALGELPQRQRQAFMLRSLEGLDVAATAAAMSCSEGSVKTHYFRALQTLRGRLGEFWS